ncbi:N-acetylneuraminate lyase B-like [Mizuhopecten yessoensis]|uniref:N-acetylneuraminate lyase n=1 Tax=Mizuhopecten yessoensis TaxID=6573 RepID=A0A210Q426_MIZYE|nr:N-acetylneuraminate lyase B-like [Mizuhopecten yessoensis]OWF43497.1 N-acetylneuraminate lyase [Mizuhopecten yessoensis]
MLTLLSRNSCSEVKYTIYTISRCTYDLTMAKTTDYWVEGLAAAVFTPFDENRQLDLSKIEPYCDHLLKHNVRYIYVNGTTGEGNSLTLQERKMVVEKWIEVSKKRLSVMVHVGCMNLTESLELTRHAEQAGADAIATLPPLFFKPTNIDALVRYCKAVADTAPHLPFYYYHLPIMSHVNLNMEDFLNRAKDEIPNMAGLKFSDKDLVDLIGCSFVDGGRYNLLYGCDEQLMAGLVTGAHGAVGSLHNFMPDLYNRMIQQLKEGDFDSARKEQIQGQRLCRIVYRYGSILGGNVAALKAIMSMIGLDMGPPREPMRAITSEEFGKYKSEIESIGFSEWH